MLVTSPVSTSATAAWPASWAAVPTEETHPAAEPASRDTATAATTMPPSSSRALGRLGGGGGLPGSAGELTGVDDVVGVALLGEEALAPGGELLLVRVPADHRVEVGLAAVLLGAQ